MAATGVRGAILAVGLVWVVAAGGPPNLGAQTATSALTGLVRDSAGTPIDHAEVLASETRSGFAYRTLSGVTGRYWLRGVPPGTYEVTALGAGHRTTAPDRVVLVIGATANLDLTVVPSAVVLPPVTVTVESRRTASESPRVSYVLDRERIESLPEESRQFIELAQLVPGATAGTDATGGPPPFGGSGATVGALNRQSLNVLVDGGTFTEGIQGELSGSLPLLAIREFEVVQGAYPAELGRAASGVVNVSTRRGSNEFMLEGFGLYRHHALTALGAFETEKPDFNRSHWGLAAGGPITPNRTHYFVAIERRVQNEFSTVNTGGAFPDEEGTFRTPFTDNLLFGRIDHRVGESHELTLRYAGEVGDQLVGVGGPFALENGRWNRLDMHGGLLAHRWSLPNGWLNEARLHVISTRRALERNAPDGPTLRYPSLRTGPHVEQALLRSLRVELRNDLSWIQEGSSGTHRLKVGALLGWVQNRVESTAFENGLFQFRTDTSSVPLVGRWSLDDAGLRLDADNLQVSVFAQDEWSPSPALTLNLGLRYDLETNGSNQGFVSPFADDLPFIRDSPRPIDKNNIAPRLGLSWRPGGDARTVVRGGFGVFYDALAAGPLLVFERSAGIRTAEILNPGTTDVSLLMVDPDNVAPVIWASGETIRTPMTRQFSVGLQRSFGDGFVARVDGLLIKGRNLLLQRNVNPLANPSAPADGRVFPEFDFVRQILTEGEADAKLLLIEARKRFTNAWFELAYTLAQRRTTNDTWSELVPSTDPNDLDLDGEWGAAAWDERHRLVVTGGIEFPLGFRVAAKAIYASARPFTVITGTDDNGDGNRQNDRPPGETRNGRRGPRFFRTDIGLTWDGLAWGLLQVGVQVNVYNLFSTTNGDPAFVQNIPRLPGFGQSLVAYPRRQVELGLQIRTAP
jgi:outer membrane receptor protein involved in Fe transport